MKINWFKILNISNLFRDQIYLLIRDGNIIPYCEFLVVLKQGKWCKDCNKLYWDCECNRCKNCKYRYCICDLDLENKSVKIGINIIRNKIFNFTLYNLNKFNINYLIMRIENGLLLIDAYEERLYVKKLLNKLKNYEN